MSLTSLQATLHRIEHAEPDSPIAVFTSDQRGMFDSAFANTSESRRRMQCDSRFVGVYDGEMDSSDIHNELSRALVASW